MLNEFGAPLARYWPEFVDCPNRLKTEAPFLLRTLARHKAGTILDAAMGSGCESTFLVRQGFSVVSNEIDEDLVEVALELANKEMVALQVTRHDWRNAEEKFGSARFDAVVLLGNSICLLPDAATIRLCLQNFYKVLKPGGTFLVDERNFRYIRRQKEEILAGRFRFSRRYVYCGTRVTGYPSKITEKRVEFEYVHADVGRIGTLSMYPFDEDELPSLIREAGFVDVRRFSDFSEQFDAKADFYTYASTKA
jgi:SAM-dependent methyltransferase